MAIGHGNPWLCAAVAMGFIVATGSVTRAEPVDALRRELDEMKRQMHEMQKHIQAQDELIKKLSAPKTAAEPPAVPTPTRAEAPPPPAPAATAAAAPREPWSPAAPIHLLQGSRGYLNLSFDALVDAGWSTTPDVTALETGDHDPLQRGFTIPNEEIFLDGAVDPYFKGVADIVFKLDQNNNTDIELEEVYLTTTSLPWRLQAKAGQYFSEFGRINQQHPHAWDFVDQPLVIGRMFGPEGLRNPGARVSWLAPTPFYSELFLGVQNSQGETAASFRDTEADSLFGRPPVDTNVRSLADMLYVPRYVAAFDLTDSQTLMVGASGAFGPNASGTDTRTQIYGGDVYWKWKPDWQSGGFPFVSWQTEALGRRYEAGAATITDGGQTTVLPREALGSWGIYSQVLYGFTQRWVAGLRGDWVTGECGAAGLSAQCGDRFRLSPDLTFYPTEFSKIRFQYNYDHGQILGDDSSVWVQLEFLLGEHSAHKF
jgi:hypothetical protein